MWKTIAYIALSIDGYIAKTNGNLDRLTSLPPSNDGGDYGYNTLLSRVNTAIMGRSTYEAILSFGDQRPYNDLNTFVVTTNKTLQIQSPNTQIIHDNLKTILTTLKKETKKDIWIVGGEKSIKSLINEDILDKMILTIVPKILGDGIPLFPKGIQESEWQLKTVQSFDTWVVQLQYERPQPTNKKTT